MGYFPHPPNGGQALLPYTRRPRYTPVQGVPLAAPQVHWGQGQGCGTLAPAAWSTEPLLVTSAAACDTASTDVAGRGTGDMSAVARPRRPACR